MNYLLDSHLLYWLRFDHPRIKNNVRELIENPEKKVFYSVISPWELSIKSAKGKLPLPEHFFDNLPNLGFECLPVEEHHIMALRKLPLLHHDPFDRMLVAQALAENLTLITRDRSLAEYPIKTLYYPA